MNSATYPAGMIATSPDLPATVTNSTSRPGELPTGAPHSSMGPFVQEGNHFGWLWQRHQSRRGMRAMTIYQLTDCLHDGRIARVPGDQIAATVSAWLAELGVHSPLADDFACAVRAGDWPAAHAIGTHLSVNVTVATQT